MWGVDNECYGVCALTHGGRVTHSVSLRSVYRRVSHNHQGKDTTDTTGDPHPRLDSEVRRHRSGDFSHRRCGSCRPHHGPPYQTLHPSGTEKIRKYPADYKNRSSHSISFIPVGVTTSDRLHNELVQILFL